jgi:hypothetical protein
MNLLRNVLLTGLLFVAPVAISADDQVTQEIVDKVTKEGSFVSNAWTTVKKYSPHHLPRVFVERCGGRAVAKWLAKPSVDKDGKAVEMGSVKKFFADYETGVARTFAIAEVAIIVAAAYKAWQMFYSTEEVDADEDASIFEDDTDEDDQDDEATAE